MKRLLLVSALILIVVLSFSFSACNNATPQGQLGDYFCEVEKFTYSAVDKTDAQNPTIGTYIMTIEKFDGGNVTLTDGFVVNGAKTGVLVSGNLNIGTTNIETKSYFQTASNNNFLVPIASWRKTSKNGEESVITQNYSQTVCDYKISETGKADKTGSLSFKLPCYDTNEIYNTLRGASTMGSGFSMSFSVPLPQENLIASLSASCNATKTLTAPDEASSEIYGEGKNCYEVILSRSTSVGGISYNLYYGVDQLSVNNWKITRPLYKIVEGNVEYLLVDVTTVK